MNTLAALQRRERAIAVVRWVAGVFAAAMVLLYEAPPGVDPGFVAGARMRGLLLVGALAGVGVAVELLLRVVRDERRLARTGLGVLAADTAIALAFLWNYTFDPVSAQWALLTVLPLEGALRFRLVGALGVWAVITPLYVLREFYGAAIHGTNPTVGSISYRLGLLGVVALFAGFMARDLDEQRRALQRLSSAQQELAASFEPAEILGTLCRTAVRVLRARSAVVYVHDGGWFHPVASWPADALPRVMAEDEQELEDDDLAERLLAGPGWLDADGAHPRRLAVPLRSWPALPSPDDGNNDATNLLVIRPRSRRADPMTEELATSLAESAALALATTRVLRAEQQTNRRLRYLEALRTRFVATVAHDLRMPLTIFKGVASMLRDWREEIAPERLDAMLGTVERQANRLSRLADDLLDAARLDADRLALHRTVCDLGAIVAATVADIQEEVRADVEEGLRLVADNARLERVLWNLLSNAEKYGKPPIEVRAWAQDNAIHLSVRDYGAGLDTHQQARLFADFEGSPDVSSVGLGLAIVWQLVTAHGGIVSYADAQPGARFTVSLPLEVPTDSGSLPIPGQDKTDIPS